jgi:hypothetical protein
MQRSSGSGSSLRRDRPAARVEIGATTDGSELGSGGG